MKVALYARVSTTDQEPETQLRDLRRYADARGFTVFGEYVDLAVSGAKVRRPGSDVVLSLARTRQIDGLVVAAFDRWGRSLSHLVRSMEEFQALGVAFISIRESMDLTTPSGRLMFGIIAAMAEFERELIRERVKAGMRRAKAQGIHCGRPRKHSEKGSAGAEIRP